MADPLVLGDFEQLVLLAVLQAVQQGEAYGIPIYEALRTRASRRVGRGAVYMTLDRLEKKGLLTSSLSAPTAERGGRAKRCYRLTRPAVTALRASRRTLLRLWDGIEAVAD